MKLKLYNVRDNVEGQFGPILSSKNDDTLRRDLKGWLASKDKNYINENWQDKAVYCIGQYDTETGTLLALPQPDFICPLQEIYDALMADIRRWKEDNKNVGNEDKEETH